MRKGHRIIYRMALGGVFAALYLILCLLDITVGRFKITLAGIVPIFVCLSFPFPDALYTMFIAVFLDQLLYGLSITTPIWAIPPLLRVLILAIYDLILRKKVIEPENKKVLTSIIVVFSSVVLSASNSLAYYLDSLIVGYTYAAVILDNVLQCIITIGSSLVELFVIFPVLKALRKTSFLSFGHTDNISILTKDLIEEKIDNDVSSDAQK